MALWKTLTYLSGMSISRTPLPKEVIDRSICEATLGLIDHLDAELPTDTLAAIIDILYFKAKWWSRFDEYDTKERVFYGADGKTMVKMMKQTESYNYAETSLGGNDILVYTK